jgi:tRNA(His) guanylyltransferase
MKHDEFGDRMKAYERAYTAHRVDPSQMLCVRIDGKGFSRFTKGFKKPFDDGLARAMTLTTQRLVTETHARVGYTQSDEITLIYSTGESANEYIFGGKVSKINSILASIATANFNAVLPSCTHLPVDKLAYFDCRAFAVPSLMEAANVLLWRVQDARKNSVSALFRWTAGHREMAGLSQAEMKEYLLKFHAVDWNTLPNRHKYGTYIKPVSYETYLTADELSRIPEKKRPDTSVLVKRNRIEEIDIGYFGDLTAEQRHEFVK